jgi:RNA polymerase sigma factor (sigma-70 family)
VKKIKGHNAENGSSLPHGEGLIEIYKGMDTMANAFSVNRQNKTCDDNRVYFTGTKKILTVEIDPDFSVRAGQQPVQEWVWSAQASEDLAEPDRPDWVTKPIASYLQNIGCFSRLCPEEEIAVAKAIEQAELEVLRAILTSEIAIDHLIGLGDRVRNSQGAPAKILKNIHKRGVRMFDKEKVDSFLKTTRQLVYPHAAAKDNRMDLRNAHLRPDQRQLLQTLLSRRIDQMFDLLKEWHFEPCVFDEIEQKLRKRPVSSGSRNHTRTLTQIALSRAKVNARRSKLIQANLRLVVSISRRYAQRGLSLVDLIQEGNTGLIRAADRYDYRRGTRFSTCAVWWIRQAILRAIYNQARTIRLPIHIRERYRKIQKAANSLRIAKNGDDNIQKLADRSGIPFDEVDRILAIAGEPLSLDAPLNSQATRFVGDAVEDRNLKDPFTAVAGRHLVEQTRKVLSVLTPREEKILRMRFGIGEKSDHTLDEISQAFDLTRERIRQIESRALQKLQQSKYSRSLRAFIER